jgi:HAD superfamily hydrolase (TIGR01549 family)
MRRTIRCILFDLGSTLWKRKDEHELQAREKESNARAVAAMREYVGLDEFPYMDPAMLGTLIRNAVERQIRAQLRQNPLIEPDFALATMEALGQLGVPHVQWKLGRAIYEALRIRIPDSRVFFDDTLPTLDALRSRGYMLGVVTNRHYGGNIFVEDLQKMGLLKYFDPAKLAVSADLGIRKPHPRIYVHALERMGVMPEEAAMVGDSLKADIAGAKNLHMLAIWKPKSSLRSEAKVAVRPVADTASWQQKANEQAESRANLAPNHLESEDDYLLDYAARRENKGIQLPREHLKPDATVERLSDLLSIFK